MVYSTRRFVVCLSVCHFVLVFFSPFSIAITSLREERANLSAFRTFVWFVLVWICRFPLPLGVWDGLRFVIVALRGLFSYLFFIIFSFLWDRWAHPSYFENRTPLKPVQGGGEGGGVCSLANYSVAYEEFQSNRVSDFPDFVCSLFPRAILFYFYYWPCVLKMMQYPVFF